MKHENINKMDAARRQLIVAIQMFFEENDPIAIHSIAGAAHQILVDLGKEKDIKSLLYDLEYIRPEKKKEVIKKIREAPNFLKHADHDPSDTCDFNPETTELFLYDSCMLYKELNPNRYTEVAEIIKFANWFLTKHPNLFE